MKKKIEVNVTGIHNRQGEPEEKINTVSEGIYEIGADGVSVIEYKEIQEADGHRLVFHNKAVISADRKTMEIQRGGAMSTKMGDEIVSDSVITIETKKRK